MVARALVAGVCLTAFYSLRAEVAFNPSVAVSATYVDNVSLVPSSQGPESDVLAQVNPGFSLTVKKPRLSANVLYNMQNLFSANDSDRNQTFHQLGSNATATLVQDALFLDLGATYTQQLIDPNRPLNGTNFFDVGNITDAAAAVVTPYYIGRFGRVKAELRYSYGIVNYSGRDSAGTALDDSSYQQIRARLGSSDSDALFAWGLQYRREESSYDLSLPYAYAQATAELDYHAGARLSLLARGGSESDLSVNLDAARLDSSFWSAGFRWQIDKLSGLEALAGHRFFGDSYFFKWDRQLARLRIGVEYQEEPGNSAQELARSQTRPPPGDQTPRLIDPSAAITPDTFVSKDFSANLAVTGRVTEITFTGFRKNRKYLTVPGSERYVGAGVGLSRRIGPRLTGAIFGTYEDGKTRENRDFKDISGRLVLERTLGRALTGQFEVVHTQRSETPGYHVNYARLSLQASF